MQTRIAFNGGEMSPEMACRTDIEAYMRGCKVLENWELSQMGGLKRRKGMRYMMDALSEGSVLMPYVYSYDVDAQGVFLVELDGGILRVLDPDGAQQVRFGGDDSFWIDPSEARWKQINNVLLITSAYYQPMALTRDGEGEWTFEPWEFKEMPWRYNELRDSAVTVTRSDTMGSASYSVDFGDLEGDEVLLDSHDYLRCSFWTESQEGFTAGASLREGIEQLTQMQAVSAGSKVAMRTDLTIRYYVCKQQWSRTDNYVAGLDSPDNYPDNFVEAENEEDFAGVTPINSLGDSGNISKGGKVAIESGYWELYTCIRDFSDSDIVVGASTPEHYPYSFVRGIAVGDAIACRGAWSFYCSGVWYGSYEVRRNYESAEISQDWEDRGLSFSQIGEASNKQLTGTEADEECYLRLFLTRSKYMGNDIAAGFPADSCSNKLIVEGYKKDIVLELVTVEDESGETVSHSWRAEEKFSDFWQGKRVFTDWSWAAFSDRYGWPQLAEMYNQRLVFVSTWAQPQTVWMSRVDDLKNFRLSGTDDSALALTMSTTSQNAITWVFAQNHRLLLGTAEAEWIISAGSSGASITSSTAVIENHGHVGSERLALAAVNKLLYIERGAGRCYEYGYSFESDSYMSRDLTVFSPHVLPSHGGVKAATMLRKPDTVVLFALEDGQIALLTYNSMHQVNAWHRWVTDGEVLSLCALPNGREEDRLYLIVRREGEVALELVDEYSGYSDGIHDYTSTLVTNALSNPLEQAVGKSPQMGTAFCFGEGWDANKVEITRDGADWMPVSVSGAQPQGWHELIAPAKWQYDNTVGLRISGNQGLHILALQG